MSEELNDSSMSNSGGFDFESILGISGHIQLPDEDPFADWTDPFGEEDGGELDQGEDKTINCFF